MGKEKKPCTRVGLVQVWEVFASTAQMAGIRPTSQGVILHTGRRHREEPGSRAREGEGVPLGEVLAALVSKPGWMRILVVEVGCMRRGGGELSGTLTCGCGFV